MFRLDHVIWATGDLERTATIFLERWGLASVEGGRHVGHGTGNRIVPLGRDYIELMGILDRREAEGSPLGRWVLGRGEGWLGWCIAADDIDAVARERNIDVVAMQRERPDGFVLRWRLAGLAEAIARPGEPFFIAWDVEASQHPGAIALSHPVRPRGIAWIEVGGGSSDARLKVRPVGGPPGVVRVAVATESHDIVIAAVP